MTGKASDAVRAITSGMTSLRSTGAALYEPWHLSHLAMAYAELGQPDDARRCIDDAINKVERSKEKWCEAEVHRIAGAIALKSVAPDTAKAEKHFERALRVAHEQQAEVIRTTRRNKPCAPLARPGQDAASSRTARSGLRLVYGGFRHARSEGGEIATRRARLKVSLNRRHLPGVRKLHDDFCPARPSFWLGVFAIVSGLILSRQR